MSAGFSARPRLPGSKSVANRALVAAALTPGATRVRNATPCDDVRYMTTGLAALGFDVDAGGHEAGELVVSGGVPAGGGDATIFCGNAGTAVRFLTALAACVPGAWTIDGDAAMRRRPIRPLVQALRGLGVEAQDTDGCPPVHIRGGAWKTHRTRLDASLSGQFLSGLLLVGGADGAALHVELQGAPASRRYIELTADVLDRFGADAHEAGPVWSVRRRADAPPPGVFEVEPDWSAAGSWLLLAELLGGRVTFDGLSNSSAQADREVGTALARLRVEGEVELDVSAMPDQTLNLGVRAAVRAGRTRLTGAANLRHKECDRLAVLARELRKLGVEARETSDGMEIVGRERLRPALIDPEGDHRVAMAFAVLGAARGGIDVEDPACIAKSDPGFVRELVRISEATLP